MKELIKIKLKLTGDKFGTQIDMVKSYELEHKLYKAVTESGLGKFDGNDHGLGYTTFYIYTSEADKLIEIIKPIVEQSMFVSTVHREEDTYEAD